MKTAELRKKSVDELRELKKKLTDDRRKVAIEFIKGKEKNNQKGQMFKKDLARVETLINEKKFMSEVQDSAEAEE